MKLVIERSELLRALGHVASVVERRTTIPILSNVLLKANERIARAQGHRSRARGDRAGPSRRCQQGAATVPAHMLHDIVRKLPDGAEIEIVRELERERLMLTAGQSRFSLQMLPADDFPDLAAGEMSHTFDLGADELRKLIDKTRFAISTEETRYYLNGIYLHTAMKGKQTTLRAVATDGHRLAQVDLDRPKGAEAWPASSFRAKPCTSCIAWSEDTSASVKIGVSAAKARFEIGPITLTSKLIDGTFPDYGRVIPQANDKAMKVSNAQFMGAVDRVSTIASERGRAVKLNISRRQAGPVGQQSRGRQRHGGAGDRVPGHTARDRLQRPLSAGHFRPDRRRQPQFLLADPGSPTMVKDGGDDSALYVLMPMRV